MRQAIIKDETRIAAVDGYYGYHNLGDDCMLVALSHILKRAGFSAIIVRSISDEPLSGMRSELPIITFRRKQLKLRGLVAWMNATRSAEAFIVGGGSLFPDDGWLRTLYRLLPLVLAKLTGRRTGLVGVSIHPVHTLLGRLVWRAASTFIDLCIVRDRMSAEILRSLFPGKDIVEGRDLTFALPVIESEHAATPKVAVIAPAHLWADTLHALPDDPARYRFLVSVLAETCEDLVSRGFRLHLVSFYEEWDDELLGDLIRSLTPTAASCSELVPRERIFESLERASIVIAMRYHAKVFSVQQSKPFVGICYDWKSTSLMQELGLNDLAVRYEREAKPTDDLGPGRVAEIIDLILSDPEKLRTILATAHDTAFGQFERSGCVERICDCLGRTGMRP